MQPRRAGVPLGRRRRVARWGAADGREHPGVREYQAVVAGHAGRLVGEAGPVQRGEQDVAGAVPGEDAPGAVAAVRGRRQPEDPDCRAGRSETRYRPAPVLLVAERCAPGRGDLLPPGDEARAGEAAGDRGVEPGEVGDGRGDGGRVARHLPHAR